MCSYDVTREALNFTVTNYCWANQKEVSSHETHQHQTRHAGCSTSGPVTHTCFQNPPKKSHRRIPSQIPCVSMRGNLPVL